MKGRGGWALVGSLLALLACSGEERCTGCMAGSPHAYGPSTYERTRASGTATVVWPEATRTFDLRRGETYSAGSPTFELMADLPREWLPVGDPSLQDAGSDDAGSGDDAGGLDDAGPDDEVDAGAQPDAFDAGRGEPIGWVRAVVGVIVLETGSGTSDLAGTPSRLVRCPSAHDRLERSARGFTCVGDPGAAPIEERLEGTISRRPDAGPQTAVTTIAVSVTTPTHARIEASVTIETWTGTGGTECY